MKASWVWTFTGKVKGQYGYAYSRAEKAFKGQVSVYYRGAEQALKRRKIIDPGIQRGHRPGDYPGRYPGHVRHYRGRAPGFCRPWPELIITRPTRSSSFHPGRAIESLLYPAFQVPFFDGEGRLAAYTKDVARTPDLTLPDYVKVHKIEATLQTGEPTNKVVVKYLDSDLSRD